MEENLMEEKIEKTERKVNLIRKIINKDVSRSLFAKLLWFVIVFEVGFLIGGMAFNRYSDYRIKESILVGSFLYSSQDENGSFLNDRKTVYNIRSQEINLYVPKTEQKKENK